MLQQTQVSTVLGYYEKWTKRFPDVAALAAAEESDVLHAWQGLGYYSRARNLHAAARTIMAQHRGIFPRKLEEIRALPGVGRYTAGAVATFAFDRSTPIVDVNIARVLARLVAITEPIDTRVGTDALWSAAESLLPSRNAGRFNAALMELGALVCTPHRPACGSCPVRTFCAAKEPATLPVKKPRRKTVRQEDRAAFVMKGEMVLLNREDARRWRGLWRLPALEVNGAAEGRLLTQLRYPITHYRVTLTVRSATTDQAKGENLEWFSLDEIRRVPMPSPHRKALTSILSSLEMLKPAPPA